MAAVSLRRTSRPKVMGNAPADLTAFISAGVKSPSGPTQTQTDCGRRLRSA